ncbi:MAG: hypothetical protein WA021_03365 [Minisyncoccia bacterium]
MMPSPGQMRVITRALIFFCVGSLTATLIAASFAYYMRQEQRKIFLHDPTRVLGINNFAGFLTIQLIDFAKGSMVAVVRSSTVNQDIPTRITFKTGLRVERQDARIENGVFIGAEPKRNANLESLTPGMRGFGVMHITEDGSAELDYLLIGDPIPHP